MALQETAVTRRLHNVKHIILVLAGKGGVGKSSVSTQLALNLYNSSPNAKVGILDVDLTGPSIPRMLGVDDKGVHQSSDGWVPVYADGPSARLALMSVGFLLKNKGDSVVWRGPKKNGMIRQFLSDVRWGELDYLVIDTPPGGPSIFYVTSPHILTEFSVIQELQMSTCRSWSILQACIHACRPSS
jgi:Mrp family chromosome partitioning ATPase